MVITGPLDLFTTSRSGEIEPEFRAGLEAASLAACAARASLVQVVPVMTAAAPITAFRIRKVRRSIFSGGVDAFSGVGVSFILEDAGFMGLELDYGFVQNRFSKLSGAGDWLSLVLNGVDVALGPSLDMGGIGFIRIDMHRESETRIHPDQDIAKDKFAVARNPDANK